VPEAERRAEQKQRNRSLQFSKRKHSPPSPLHLTSTLLRISSERLHSLLRIPLLFLHQFFLANTPSRSAYLSHTYTNAICKSARPTHCLLRSQDLTQDICLHSLAKHQTPVPAASPDEHYDFLTAFAFSIEAQVQKVFEATIKQKHTCSFA
jgi:hypothetical protein